MTSASWTESRQGCNLDSAWIAPVPLLFSRGGLQGHSVIQQAFFKQARVWSRVLREELQGQPSGSSRTSKGDRLTTRWGLKGEWGSSRWGWGRVKRRGLGWGAFQVGERAGLRRAQRLMTTRRDGTHKPGLCTHACERDGSCRSSPCASCLFPNTSHLR